MPILHLQKCRSNNPSKETVKESHKAYTVHCPFSICRSVKVAIHQRRQWGKTIRHTRLPVILHLQKCRSNNPSKETMKENHKAYTVTCSFFICRCVEVAIHQWRQGKETIRHIRLPVILHLQMCKNNNPLMENRVWKGQISSTYVSLIPELWA